MTQEIPGWLWVATFALYAALFVLDLAVVGRRPHVPSMQECLRWLGFYVGLAVLFGLALSFFTSHEVGVQFFAGWITEYSLSVDNLFVFILIMARFYVPRELQQAVLMWGIIIALVLRAIFIVIGAAVIAQFSWVFYIFGAFLVYTAIKLSTHGQDDDEEFHESALVRFVGRIVTTTQEFSGTKLRVVHGAAMVWTPMIVVLVALGTTDLLFALDSIPAIFGLTKIPYVVFAANVFALLGLRQLYFLLGGLLDRLIYLSVGLAVVLGFIGIKLVLEAMHTNTLPFVNGGEPLGVPVPSTQISLALIIGVLAVTAATSLVVSGRRDRRAEHPD
ncbi:MAG: TerC family protein [Candidatus Nanopelagicales bacterium]